MLNSIKSLYGLVQWVMVVILDFGFKKYFCTYFSVTGSPHIRNAEILAKQHSGLSKPGG